MSLITVSDFYKKIFGSKVYKISIDAGCTCPNRDGTLGFGGCIFCSQSGSGDFAADRNKSVIEQIQNAKKLVEKKCSSKKYIAYFQNFTNTYGNLDLLFEKWDQALQDSQVCGIAIATRPDCLGEKVISRLAQLSQKTYLQVELGLQTTNSKTARYIRRGFENQVYARAVEQLHAASKKIHVVTHVIFGLPGETDEDMLETVKYVNGCGSDGIKMTVLYVLKGTDLEKDYLRGKFKVLEKNDYLRILEKALLYINQNNNKMVIHRFTGDPPKKILIAPLWTTDKKMVLNDCNKLFLHINTLGSNI